MGELTDRANMSLKVVSMSQWIINEAFEVLIAVISLLPNMHIFGRPQNR
jgi:hypothetical protein